MERRRSATRAWQQVLDLEETKGPQEIKQSVDKLPVGAKPELSYAHISIQEPDDVKYGTENARAAQRILRCLNIRRKYVGPAAVQHVPPDTVSLQAKKSAKVQWRSVLAVLDADSQLSLKEGQDKRIHWDPFSGTPLPRDAALALGFEDGIYAVRDRASGELIDPMATVSMDEFCKDYVFVLTTFQDRNCISTCSQRLWELELKFDLHLHRNAARENERQRQGARDWYAIRKVDTHIHHSACFTQRQLMHFIRRKMREEGDTPVLVEGGRVLSLCEVFSSAGIDDSEDVNADRLCCMASVGGGGGQHDTFGRFDKFNAKYNPFGDKRLRDIFLKTDNYIEGRFLAELTREVMAVHSRQKFICAEWRISIYGRSRDEWEKLAKWFRKYSIQCQQVRWLIQVPRIYPVFKKLGVVWSFGDMLENVFGPLFEASIDPEGHEDMFYLLKQVVGFDSVDDESQGSETKLKEYPRPEDWTSEVNPPYTCWMYYMYSNIRALNSLRRRRGLNTFVFRPHCGEAGNPSHLCAGFMLADGICHGVQLRKTPVMEYLYYIAQVGLAVSPLSNDILFVPLGESPFGSFFKRGLNVSLSTDDPLIIHLTEDPLIEEYVVAARTFRLSMCDLCEIARNSVLQSGFEEAFKDWWVGPREEGCLGDEEKANVPLIRLHFRADCLKAEMAFLEAASSELSSLLPG